MADEPTDRETALATRIVDLRDKSGRPKVAGSGPVVDTLNFVSARAPLALIRLGLIVFLAYVAWGYYTRAQQMVFDLKSKEAEVTKTQVEADAVRHKVNEETAQRATLKAQIAKIKADAATAEAEAQAAKAEIGGVSARLAGLRAEMELARAEGDKAQAEANAQNQVIDGVPLNVSQKKAEIAVATGEVKKSIQGLCIMLFGLQGFREDGTVDVMWSFNHSVNDMSCPGLR
jgi:hypothetical protein